jgi:Mitochondrial carrier protein
MQVAVDATRDAGIINCGTTIIREEGATSLWKGLTPFAGNLTLKYFLRFGTNGLYQNLLRDSVGNVDLHLTTATLQDALHLGSGVC